MAYDFTTLTDRHNTGAIKWNLMSEGGQEIPDDIVPFSVADMEFKNPPEVIEGMKAYLDQAVLGYTVPTKTYWENLEGWMERRHHWKISRDMVVGVPGVVPALGFGLEAFTQPGDKVLIMTPVYYPFYRVIKAYDRVALECPLIYGEDGRYTIDFETFEELASEAETTAFILCDPHNPVGRVFTVEELTRLGNICLKHGLKVIADEIHSDLIMPGYTHTMFASICPEFAAVTMTCTAPSKTFNLAGMQLSNIIFQEKDMFEAYQAVMDKHQMHGVNALAIIACQTAYAQCEGWLDELLIVIDGNRQFVEDFVRREMPLVKVSPLEGTYLLWMNFGGICQEAEKLEAAMKENFLFLDEGYVFGHGGKGFERMVLACPRQVIEAAMYRMKQVYDKIPFYTLTK